jgi:hypothetical protein
MRHQQYCHNHRLLLLLLPFLLLQLASFGAEAQIFPGSGLTAPSSDLFSGRFLNSLNTTQVTLLISIGGLVILAIAGGLLLLSLFRPSSAPTLASGYSHGGGDYNAGSASSVQKEYAYPGYRSLRYLI